MAIVAEYKGLPAYVAAVIRDPWMRRFVIPTDDAAAMLGLTRQRMHQMIAQNRLQAVRVRMLGKWGYLFNEAELVDRLRIMGDRASVSIDDEQSSGVPSPER